MPLKSTGNIISKIKINKKNVVLTFQNKDKVTISYDAYANYYLYVGKELSRKEMNDIVDFSNLEKAMSYATTLLKRYHYSEYRLREKLYAKEYTKKDVDKVIDFLKKHDLINDMMFALDLKAYGDERNLGKHKIIQDLQNKGIFPEEINKLKFPINLERKKAYNQLKRLEKKYASESYEKRKQHIYASLMNLGFDHDVVNEVMNDITEKDDKKELKQLRLDYDKARTRLNRKYEDEELKEQLMKTLRNRGYRYNDIRKVMEEKEL